MPAPHHLWQLITTHLIILSKIFRISANPSQHLKEFIEFVNPLENQWTKHKYLLGKPMDHAHGKSHDTWENQGYWIFQWLSPSEIPWGVKIRFFTPGGILIGTYHAKFLFITTKVFMYTFRRTRLKILNVIVRSTNDAVSIKNWSKYSCENAKL